MSTATKENDIFEKMSQLHNGQLHFFTDSTHALQAIVAIDSLARGPALGGCRFVEYDSTHEAIHDVIRLAKGMTLKAAITNLNFGGGKAVIIKPKQLKNRQKLFERFADFFHALNGQYITAMDSGTTLEDMQTIANKTDYVIHLKPHHQFPTANPSSYTALGIFYGIQAAAQHRFNSTNLNNLHIAISGMGNVGYALGEYLIKAGAHLTITDINPRAIQSFLKQYPAQTCSPEQFYSLPCDILSPCALGGCLNKETIPQLNTKIIAGSANNQLATKDCGKEIHSRNILYTPDFALNAGGLIQATSLYLNHNEHTALKKIKSIYEIIQTIFTRAQQKNQSPETVAIELAIENLPIDRSVAYQCYMQ